MFPSLQAEGEGNATVCLAHRAANGCRFVFSLITRVGSVLCNELLPRGSCSVSLFEVMGEMAEPRDGEEVNRFSGRKPAFTYQEDQETVWQGAGRENHLNTGKRS